MSVRGRRIRLGPRRTSWLRLPPPHPPRRISLRIYATGQGLRDIPDFDPPELLQESKDLLLLIHGYNVTMAAAEDVYDAFAAGLRESTTLEASSLFWPGDATRNREVGDKEPGRVAILLSAMSYWRQIHVAVRSARRISDAILEELDRREASRRAGNYALEPIRLYVVAHSLGCRLALEVLRGIEARNHFELLVPLVALMAAAVPMYQVAKDGGLERALRRSEDVLIYSSKRDLALVFFRPGQFVEWSLPHGKLRARGALGRIGIGGLENIHPRPTSKGHSDYWRDPDIAAEIGNSIDAGGVAAAQGRLSNAPLGRALGGREISPRSL